MLDNKFVPDKNLWPMIQKLEEKRKKKKKKKKKKEKCGNMSHTHTKKI